MSGTRGLKRLARDTLRQALLVSASLEKELSDLEGDSKRARELTAILKDLTGLARDLREEEAAPVTVRFVGETEEAGE